MRTHLIPLPLVAVLLFVVGCASTGTATNPPTPSTFDQTAYSTLVTVQAALDQARVEIAAASPGSPAASPAVVHAFNTVSAAYNVAESTYLTYHSSVVAGGAADSAALSQEIAQLVADAAALVLQLHPKGTAP